MFTYVTGEVVQIGDIVRICAAADHTDVVAEIAPPGSEQAQAFWCPKGGVFLKPSGVFIQPEEDRSWEDVAFIARSGSRGPGRGRCQDELS